MLYSIAVSAKRNDGAIVVNAGFAIADSKEQAIGIGIEMAKNGDFKIGDGWTNHGVSVCEISLDFIARALTVKERNSEKQNIEN